MRHLVLFFILFILTSLTLFGQPDVTTCSQNEPTDTIKPANSKSCVLYVGIDNEVFINKKYLGTDSISLTTTNGEVFDDDGKFYIIPTGKGIANIKIYKTIKGQPVYVYSRTFEVKPLPAPYVVLGGLKMNDRKEINKQYLLKNQTFAIKISEDLIEDTSWFKIKEITFGYSFGNMFMTKTCDGDKFSQKIKDEILRVAPGKEISLIIKVQSSEGMVKTMPIIKLAVY